MKKRLIAAVLALWPSLALAGGNYPASLPDATHVSQSLSQTRANTIIDEVWNLANELGLNYAARGIKNLVANSSVETWSGGTSVAPDNWTLSGTGAAVARQSDGQDGTYSAQITAGSAASKLDQVLISTISAAVNARLRATVSFTMTARVRASAVNACRLQIGDGVGTSQSSYHAGDGAWAILSVTRTLDASATQLYVDLLDDATDSATTCRFDSVMLLEGKFPGRAFGEKPALAPVPDADIASMAASKLIGAMLTGQTVTAGTGSGAATLVGIISLQTGSVCTGANTTETDLFTFSLPANSLSTTGKGLRITTWGKGAANANAKKIRVYFGAANAVLGNSTQSGMSWLSDTIVVATGANTQAGHDYIRFAVTGQDALTRADADQLTATETTSGAITIKVTGQNGTASANDICGKGMMVEMLN